MSAADAALGKEMQEIGDAMLISLKVQPSEFDSMLVEDARRVMGSYTSALRSGK